MISDAGSWYLQDTGLWPDAESCGEECPNIWGAANSEFILLVGADRWTSLGGFLGSQIRSLELFHHFFSIRRCYDLTPRLNMSILDAQDPRV